MTLPGALLAFLVASILGLVYHLIRGGGMRRLFLYCICAWIAFFGGHWLGSTLGWTTWRWGSLNLLPAILSTGLVLVIVDILAGPRNRSRHKQRKSPRQRR